MADPSTKNSTKKEINISAGLFNNILDLIANRGVLVIAEAMGFYYLFISIHKDQFDLNAALIGLSLVLIGTVFEYLVVLAKRDVILNEINKKYIEKEEASKEIKELRNELLNDLDDFKKKNGKYLEQ